MSGSGRRRCRQPTHPAIHPEVAGSLLPDAELAKTIAVPQWASTDVGLESACPSQLCSAPLRKVFTDSYKTCQEIRSVTGTELREKYESVIKEPG